MIEVLSKITMDYLQRCNLVKKTDGDYDHYKYGIEITISSLINLIIVFFIGLLINKILYSFIFLSIFISLRQLTGGYHAKTYFKCNLTMCISFLLVAFGTAIINDVQLLFFSIHILLSTLIELIYCPVENANKPIAYKSKNKYKINAILTSMILSIIGYIISLKHNEYGTCIIMTIIIINILIIVSQIKRGEKNENQN